ncbi:DUF262 domain-containing protein [Candidatus Nitrosacidococcus sp. I8]|uniref:DUF262 domain-containing protein n=1 Tax=Candidatus Nitrosacidococcus sp. I8 TaxID=2942908 RepID=UPI002227EEAD|nr:DUF262 domain-containing HNH endonuclease family protein [Candidatus Nitrosacidococcus sp. I8]
MKTDNCSISDVLEKNSTSFFIPPFQRSYAWGKTEIERFFDDMLRIIESELDPKQIDKLEHFFGTLVIKNENEVLATKSIVVDGQQRLTTTLLFLIALRDLEKDTNKQNLITQRYLINSTSTFQDKIKLKQVSKDWEAYKALVNKESPEQLGIICNAYGQFANLIKKQARPEIELEHYITAIRRMNVAVISLDERPYKGEDPQIIFETLNSLGKPLTLSDLVRNFILLNMKSDDQARIYEQIWYPKIESILGDHISHFFRDYLQYKVSRLIKVVSDNNTKEIYHQFRGFVNKEFTDRSQFIGDIIQYVNWYHWIINTNPKEIGQIAHSAGNDKEIKELLRNIFHDIKSDPFKPFVLGLLEYHQDKEKAVHLSDDKLISILKIICTYLIRRRTLGLTQGENKEIVLLSHRIEELADESTSMLELLSNMPYNARLPNDGEIKKRLQEMDFYNSVKNYGKFIFGKIEKCNTKGVVNFRNSKITIEHIMPQKLNKTWEQELGDNFSEIHKKYLHNIGNLTITEFNSEMGNKSFTEKKEKFNQSALYFRLDIINQEKWNEESILAHQNSMITWFLNTFSLPDKYKEKDNWKINSSTTKTNTFSPLDEEAGEIATGNKPEKVSIDGTEYPTKSWQDAFLAFLLYIRNSSEFDFEIILNNQNDLFGRENIIVKWVAFQDLVENENENDLEKNIKPSQGSFGMKKQI